MLAQQLATAKNQGRRKSTACNIIRHAICHLDCRRAEILKGFEIFNDRSRLKGINERLELSTSQWQVVTLQRATMREHSIAWIQYASRNWSSLATTLSFAGTDVVTTD